MERFSLVSPPNPRMGNGGRRGQEPDFCGGFAELLAHPLPLLPGWESLNSPCVPGPALGVSASPVAPSHVDPVKWVLFLQRAWRIVYPRQRARQCLLVTGSSGGDPAGSTSR